MLSLAGALTMSQSWKASLEASSSDTRGVTALTASCSPSSCCSCALLRSRTLQWQQPLSLAVPVQQQQQQQQLMSWLA